MGLMIDDRLNEKGSVLQLLLEVQILFAIPEQP